MKYKEIEDKYKTNSLYNYNKDILANKDNFSQDELQYKYLNITKYLNSKYRIETLRTTEETKFYKWISKGFKKYIYTSVWIGNHNVDIFIPKLKLAIEIDGGIHNNEIKMRKDELKDKYLKDQFGIVTMHIDNKDIGPRSSDIIKLLSNKNSFVIKNTASLWRKIYIETLATHLDTIARQNSLLELFRIRRILAYIDKLYSKISKKKGFVGKLTGEVSLWTKKLQVIQIAKNRIQT